MDQCGGVHGSLAERSWLSGGTGSALGFGSAALSALLGALGGALFGWPARAPITLGLLLGSVLCVSAVTTLTGAVSTAAQSWAVYSGFVLHRMGELRLEQQDRVVLGCLLAVALLAGGAARLLADLPGRHRRRVTWTPSRFPRPMLTPRHGLVSTVTEASIPRQERPHRR
jgi:hypothetical protein